MATGMMPPTMIVCPDLYTEFGGSQYIDSEFFGSHGSYVAHEVVSYINEHYGPKTQAIFGRSSGAFGALRIAMDYPGVFSGVAAHSADLGFSQMFATDLLSLCDKLRRYHYSIEAFLTYTRILSSEWSLC
jgi:S-formylglutathione hydrolase FrmB